MCARAHVHICVLCGLVRMYVCLTYVDTAGALLQSPGWGSQASPMVVLVMKSVFLEMVLLRGQVGWTDSRGQVGWTDSRGQVGWTDSRVKCSWNVEH